MDNLYTPVFAQMCSFKSFQLQVGKNKTNIFCFILVIKLACLVLSMPKTEGIMLFYREAFPMSFFVLRQFAGCVLKLQQWASSQEELFSYSA